MDTTADFLAGVSVLLLGLGAVPLVRGLVARLEAGLEAAALDLGLPALEAGLGVGEAEAEIAATGAGEDISKVKMLDGEEFARVGVGALAKVEGRRRVGFGITELAPDAFMGACPMYPRDRRNASR